jgi:hypothetical protein
METICSSERSVDIQRTTRHYIPEDGTPQNVNVIMNVEVISDLEVFYLKTLSQHYAGKAQTYEMLH